MKISQFSIKRPTFISMLVLGLCLLGVISWTQLPMQLLPRLVFPQLIVFLSMPTASPETIERELIIPAEGSIATLDNIKEMESSANRGYGTIRIFYRHGTDMKFAFLKLQQKMAALKSILPENSGLVVRRFDTERLSSILMQLSLRGKVGLEELRLMAENKIGPMLERIDGVVNVSYSGGKEKIIEINIDPEKLRYYKIPIQRVKEKIDSFNRPKEFLGQVEEQDRILYVTISETFDDLEEIENLILDPGVPIFLRHVAEIKLTYREQSSLYRINGMSTVGLTVFKDDLSNMISLSDEVLKVIDQLNRELYEEGIELVVSFNQADWMKRAIIKVEKLAVIGAFLALLVLLFFLRNLRTVGIILMAIPVSILITFNLMYFSDITLNILSLVGLALAIGILVDNSIVVLENISRHREKGADPTHAAVYGSSEVSRSIIASTLTTAVVFLPFIFTRDEILIIGRELSLSVVFPLFVSLFVAISVVPMLAARAMRGKRSGIETVFSPLSTGHRILEIYTLLLKTCLRYPVRTLIMVIVFFFLTLSISIPFLLTNRPTEPPDNFEINVEMPRGSKIESTDIVVQQIEAYARELSGVDEIRSNIREENASITVQFLPERDREKKISVKEEREKLKRKLNSIRGPIIQVEQTGEGVYRESGGPGRSLFGLGGRPEKIIIRGPGIEMLENLADEIKYLLSSVDEVENVRTNFSRGTPELQIKGNYEALAGLDLTVADLMRLIYSSRNAEQTARYGFTMLNRTIPIEIKVKDADKRRIEDLKDLMIPSPAGISVPIKEVSQFRISEGPYSIKRRNQIREIQITYIFSSKVSKSQTRLSQLRRETDELIREVNVPPGYIIEIEHGEEEKSTILWIIAVSGILIFMILAAVFESFYAPFVIFGTIPLATIGSFWALTITGSPLFVGEFPMGLLGMLILLGIVVNNGIILIDYIQILRRKWCYNRIRAIIAAGRARVRPILMTSLTTALGLLPLAFKTGEMGEIWPPFAISVIGGLSVAALFTLIFIPVVYLNLDIFAGWLKKLKLPVLLANIGLAAGLAAITYFYTETVFWKIFYWTVISFSVPGITWFIQKVIGKRRKKKDISGDGISIEIKNLTKIYNYPGKFGIEWEKEKRRKLNLMKRGALIFQKKRVLDSLLWKIPVSGFIIYLNIFFENIFWKTWVAVGTLFLIKHLKNVSFDLLRDRKGSLSRGIGKVKDRLDPILFWLLPSILFTYLWRMWYNVPAAVILGFTWYLLQFMIYTGSGIRSGRIKMTRKAEGPGKIRYKIYNMVWNIPVIGKKRTPVKALKGVNLHIGRGMFGLLGPNGAGKTTLMRLLCGILRETRGSITINGEKVSEHMEALQTIIGYLPQDFGLYENMTAEEYLDYQALLFDYYDPFKRREIVKNILKKVGLFERGKEKLKNYSGGMKQRMGIARTLLNLPRIVIVDEPTAGLDPRERIRFRNLLVEMSKERAVIFSTHIVEDISTSCSHMAVLNEGEIIYTGAPHGMIEMVRGRVWEAIVSPTHLNKIRKSLKILGHVKHDGGIKIRFLGEENEIKELFTEKRMVKPVKPNMEDAYVYLLGKAGGVN
ncbi:MAG: efflux RND transporter permease subunit [Fidelibacterota bacterium]